MITIDYTNSYIEGEPGPNLYWFGKPDDFLQLTIDLHKLGRDNGFQILMEEYGYVDILSDYSILLKSSNNGKYLSKVNEKRILIDLDSELWRVILSIFLGISFKPSHNYIDLEGIDIIEDANIIVSSEF